MFNKTIVHQQSDRLVPYEKTVTEVRAPTDASIRLYGEMLQKAYGSLLGTLVIKDNPVAIQAIVYQDYQAFCKSMRYSLKLAGHTYEGTVLMDDSIPEPTPVDWLKKVAHELSDKLAAEIMAHIIKSEEFPNMFRQRGPVRAFPAAGAKS